MSFPLQPNPEATPPAPTKPRPWRGAFIVPVGEPGALTVGEQIMANLWHGNEALVMARGHFNGPHKAHRLGSYRLTRGALERLNAQGVIQVTKGRKGRGATRVIRGPRFAAVASYLQGVEIPGLKRSLSTETDDERRAFDHLQAAEIRTDRKHRHCCPVPRVLEVVPYRSRFNKRGQRRQRPGRVYYRGWCNAQTFPADLRALLSLHFRGEDFPDLVELDYNAMQPRLLYAMVGSQPESDPYSMVSEALGVGDQYRPEIKAASMRVINAKGRSNGIESLGRLWCRQTEDWPEWSVPFTAESFAAAFEQVHGPAIGPLLWRPTSDRLQHQDSEILLRIILRCAEAGVPVIPIHDAVLIPDQHQALVGGFMDQSSKEVAGQVLPWSVKLMKSLPWPSLQVPPQPTRREHP